MIYNEMVIDIQIFIREASEEDYSGIVEVHCSDMDKLFKRLRNKKVEVSYEELTPFER